MMTLQGCERFVRARVVPIVAVCLLIVCDLPTSQGETPVTPIGSLLVNPTAFHRKVLKLEGTAKNVAVYSGAELGTSQPLCGADFDLQDDTGTIEAMYHVRCQAGDQRAATVANGMRVLLEGHMEAPPTVIRTPDGKELGFRFIRRHPHLE